MATEEEENFNLDSVFEEPPRPPTPEPTIATYTREKELCSTDGWTEIKIRLVGSHPLWAHYLWNAALALASYLDTNQVIYRDRYVLELGAGGALPSIVTAKNGARKVVVTDYPDAGYIWGHPVNTLLNALPTKNQSEKFHLIILSDLIFNHSQHDALLKTCELSLSERSSEDRENEPSILRYGFFKKAEDRGWLCEEIVTKMFPPMFPEDSGEESIRSTVHGWKLTRGILTPKSGFMEHRVLEIGTPSFPYPKVLIRKTNNGPSYETH
ncbi:hypothetical protein CPB84DRAFT_1815211 [Gymnopilus junonius]|uniref:Protein N-terminal and lysine N-methyltransferase EFM7 n=1 Tax=Gymnopilus junonius TaxID=109634 RepID=A0A9P5NRC4_GYMJU|nr:hypothetical protein CPB84DRAFT_1815211 [Gymnopilus junonius]